MQKERVNSGNQDVSTKWDNAWVLIPIALACLPLLLFGTPSFYGDDYHSFLGLQENGFWGYYWHWLDNYGMSYRPIGILLSNSAYYFIDRNETVFYWASMLLYSFVVFLVFHFLKKITGNISFAVFAAVFFALFPFNSTAFLQLPSLYMIIATVLIVLLIGLVGVKKSDYDVKSLIILSVSWVFILFVYEQVTGLVAVITLLIFSGRRVYGYSVAFTKSLKPALLLAVVTLLFMWLYFYAAGNPKIVTLQTINNEVIDQRETAGKEQLEASTNAIAVQKSSVDDTRFQSVMTKTKKVYSYLVHSIKYTWSSLIAEGVYGYLVLLIFLFSTIVIYYLPVEPIRRSTAGVTALLGFLWCVSTISPFLLYKSVHIPPYNFMIPSIGAGILLVGLYWLLWPQKFDEIAKRVFRFGLSAVLIFFAFIQYGYYFGLKEELSYWQNVAENVKIITPAIDAGRVVQITKIPEKNNRHIFWLEKAVGERYFSVQFGENQYEYVFEISTDGSHKSIRISLQESTGTVQVYDFGNLQNRL